MNKRLDNILVCICNWNPRERKGDTNRNCAPRKWEFAECAQSMKRPRTDKTLARSQMYVKNASQSFF